MSIIDIKDVCDILEDVATAGNEMRQRCRQRRQEAPEESDRILRHSGVPITRAADLGAAAQKAVEAADAAGK